MIESIIKLTKKYPPLYNFLKNNTFVNGLLNYIYLSLFVLKKEKGFYKFFLSNTFAYYILRKKGDITFNFKGNNITMPRHLKGMDAFIEVWSDEFYEKIKGYNNVLDLGGYIGDSALKLAENNKNVIVYEALTENFKYLQLNTKNHKNIKSYNYAVVGDTKSNKSIKFYGGGFNMGAGTGYVQSSKNFTEVPTKSIIEILKNDDFDALKMDIEGAEYECLDALMKDKKENLFKFKAGFIEFHLGDKFGENMKKTEKIVEWIKEKGYKIKFYDVLKNENVESLDKMKSQVFLVYFNK